MTVPHMGHEATDTGLAYAPVSQAHGHHHTQFNVSPSGGGGGHEATDTGLAYAPVSQAHGHPPYGGGGIARGHGGLCSSVLDTNPRGVGTGVREGGGGGNSSPFGGHF